jgi:hypothetical protein
LLQSLNIKSIYCRVISVNLNTIYCRVLSANLKNIYCRLLSMNLKSIFSLIQSIKINMECSRVVLQDRQTYKSSSSHKKWIYRHYASLLFILDVSCKQLHLQTCHTKWQWHNINDNNCYCFMTRTDYPH